MIEDSVGIQLNEASGESVHLYQKWVMKDFTDYNEPITLQNA